MSRNFELLQQAGREVVLEGDEGIRQPQAGVFGAQPESFILEESPLLPEMDQYSREQICKLVRQVFLLPGGSRAVVLAGVEAGNGSSWMAAQCARALAAQVPGSVCLVDANLRNPTLHQFFSVDNQARGFNDAIREPGALREFARQLPEMRNLWLMSCGSGAGQNGQTPPAPEALRLRMGELRSAFDYVLFDAPSVSLCADAAALGRCADGVVLVVAENDTHKERARYAVQELSAAKVRVLGAVLNKRTFPIPQKIYDRL